MALLTAVQVADYWIGAGGPKARAVEWVAIAMGESGLRSDVVSPVGAIGLWQIMPFNAAPNGVSVGALYDPAVNARVAVQMSGGGTNCAAWDSAYLDINRSGRYSFLAYPEQGSADYNNLAAAAAELAGHGLGGITSPGSPGVDDTLGGTVPRFQAVGGRVIPAVTARAARVNAQLATIGRKGWRP